MENKIFEDLMDRFVDAWNEHNIDKLMSMMHEDCVYYAAAGENREGAIYKGKASVAVSYGKIFDLYPDAHWNLTGKLIYKDKGVSEWLFTGTKINGETVEVMGCDIFKFKDGLIEVKDSYRKNVI